MDSETENPTPGNPEEDHPAQEAHGGSMAPGLVTDTGEKETEDPPTSDSTGASSGASTSGPASASTGAPSSAPAGAPTSGEE
jgi:hypothetical protein